MHKDIDLILKDKKISRQLNEDIAKVLNENSGLMVYYKNNTPIYLHGIYRLVDDEGVEQSNWNIKLIIPIKYPFAFPKLYELSNKIERIADNHINEEGLICVENSMNEDYLKQKGMKLYDFIATYVVKYFCWILSAQRIGREGLQEWKHECDGIKQVFIEALSSSDLNFILNCYERLKKRNFPSRNENCFCGSSKKYKNCHETGIQSLDKYGIEILTKYISVFEPIL